MKADISEWTKQYNAIIKVQKKLPSEIASLSVKFSKERFREQAWKDRSKEKWKPRARKRQGSRKRSQTLLIESGRLKRSIRAIHVSNSRIVIGTDAPYASIHNFGGTIKGTVNVKAHNRRKSINRNQRGENRKRNKRIENGTIRVKAHTRTLNTKIPQRQFLGNSYTLRKRIELLISARYYRALKNR